MYYYTADIVALSLQTVSYHSYPRVVCMQASNLIRKRGQANALTYRESHCYKATIKDILELEKKRESCYYWQIPLYSPIVTGPMAQTINNLEVILQIYVLSQDSISGA